MSVAGRRSWHVLLIGGPSGVGKSELAEELRRRHNVGSSELDDILSAAQAVTTAESHPALHPPDLEHASPEIVVRSLFATAHALRPAVEAVIATHLDHGPPGIIEGDYLLPSVLDPFNVAGARVRAVFLHDEEAQILANLTHREPATDAQIARATASHLYGLELRNQARRHKLPVFSPRPWSTLLQRVETALEH